jgi:hypothetical protein
MAFARGLRLVAIAVTTTVLLASCQSSDPPESRDRTTIDGDPSDPSRRADSTTRPAAATTRAPSPTTTRVRTPPPQQWTTRSFVEGESGTSRTCVELTTPTTSASTCLGLAGVSSWTVADAHFVVARSDITLTDGTVIRADASGVAIGLLPDGVRPVNDAADNCTRSSLAPALADHYPGSTVVWVPGRCAGGAASVSATLADRSEVIALAAQANDGHWEVFATFRAPVRCALLDVMSRNLCKLLRYDD